MIRATVRRRCLLATLALAVTPATLPAQDWSVDWWSIDGGGELYAEGGDWTLSGTLGQWESTESSQQEGGPWQLIGGFWAATAGPGDLIFMDEFESPSRSVSGEAGR